MQGLPKRTTTQRSVAAAVDEGDQMTDGEFEQSNKIDEDDHGRGNETRPTGAPVSADDANSQQTGEYATAFERHRGRAAAGPRAAA
jgi:hypothetical protein